MGSIEQIMDKTSLFQLNPCDLPAIASDILKTPMNALSPFTAFHATAGQGQTSSLEQLKAFCAKAETREALVAILQPDRVITLTSGGNTAPLSPGLICIKEGTPTTLAYLTPSYEKAWLVYLFPDSKALAEWLIDDLSAPLEKLGEARFPDVLSLESVFYVFHAIDTYRRIIYESMLETKPLGELQIPSKRFFETLAPTVKSGDLRWLLSSFTALFPGLATLPFKPGAEHLRALLEQEILIPAKADNANESVLVFGRRGRDLASEFYSCLWKCSGIEAKSLVEGKGRIDHRSFVAGTTLNNHAFSLRQNGDGKAVLDYHSLSNVQFREQLEQLFDRCQAGQGAPSFCHSCGMALQETHAFCPGCGKPRKEPVKAPSADEVKGCPTCHAPLKANRQFCGKCGTTI